MTLTGATTSGLPRAAPRLFALVLLGLAGPHCLHAADLPVPAASVPNSAGRAGAAAPDVATAANLPRSAASLPASNEFPLGIVLNGVNKGDAMVIAQGEDFLLPEKILRSIGLVQLDPARRILVNGEAYYSMTAMRGVVTVFDEKAAALKIQADPALLIRQNIDMAAIGNVAPTLQNGFFVNYGVTQTGANLPGSATSYQFSEEFAGRVGGWLLSSTQADNYALGHMASQRLMTSASRDDVGDLTRLVAGDFMTNSGDWGSSFNMAGLSYSKLYQISPYMIKTPTGQFSGTVATPSEVDVYLDGIRVRTENIAPGRFDLSNLNYYGGLRDVQIVVKDQLGNVQTSTYRQYFTDTLLGRGLQEYSYNAGFQRRQFGIESNDYGQPGVSAFHRYGLTNALTIGARMDALPGQYSFGQNISAILGDHGTVTATLAQSGSSPQITGLAAGAAYAYQNHALALRAFSRAQSNNFFIPTADTSPAASQISGRTLTDSGAGVSYSDRVYGVFGANVEVVRREAMQNKDIVTLSWTKVFAQNLTAVVSLSRIVDTPNDTQLTFGLAWRFGTDYTASAQSTRQYSGNTSTVQYAKNVPLGEGYGYRVGVDRTSSPSDSSGFPAAPSTTAVSPWFQVNAPAGIATVDLKQTMSGGSPVTINRSLTWSGSIASVGGAWAAGRPIRDSFAIVDAHLPGMHIYANGQDIGTTSWNGYLLTTSLGSYAKTQISLGEKDLPVDHVVSKMEQTVTPGYRSGVLVDFDVRPLRALTGKVFFPDAGNILPAEFVEVTMTQVKSEATGKAGGRLEQVVPTGRGGEFYFEVPGAGTWEGHLSVAGRMCAFAAVMPDHGTTVADIGKVVCTLDRPEGDAGNPHGTMLPIPTQTVPGVVPAR
jgi:outer membrane usher protein FimD/PapC